MTPRRKVAVIGSGISGLAAAYHLRDIASVTLFEAGGYFGGHTHTVDVTLPDATSGLPVTHGVDTGFLVFNERTYPNLIALFAELGVESAKSDMSFSVQVPHGHGRDRPLEWSGSDLNTVFAQRSNLLRPRFWRMLRDLLRFNALTTRLAEANEDHALREPLGDFLRRHRFSDEFRDWYFLPMIGCIWSCPTDQMLAFPVSTMIRFCHNHGLIQVSNRPQWWTVRGGARHYVEKILPHIAQKKLRTPVLAIERTGDGVNVCTALREDRFDEVIVATHSDQALAMLTDASELEREVLGAIRYHPNRAVLHTDASVLPERRSAWAAWNYERATDGGRESAQVCLHYLLNKLQPLPWTQPVVVSLNPTRDIASRHVIGEYEYAHPVFDLAAVQAQARVPALQGDRHTWYCGAWTGYGFHEDGLKAGMAVARELRLQWSRSSHPAAQTAGHATPDPRSATAHANEGPDAGPRSSS
ncbi:MAG: FAD-dependent oxidoreductase [Betaproteobacteria bacterium]|nr:FAD-dependent oxidoreductase [Betaproteobacteria bacterium]